MPELPEVETVRRGLQPVMEGARLARIELRRKDLRFPFPENLSDTMTGRTISALSRRAKYLIMGTENGPSLICHLGMSGSFRIEQDGEDATPGVFHHERSKLAAHDHVVFHLEGAGRPPARVVFNDPRRFGFMLLADGQPDDHPMLRELGTEPTGNALDGELLRTLLRDKRSPLKASLLDQTKIAGLGNIYVCEALWRAKLSPLRQSSTIAVSGKRAKERSNALAIAVREVIADAIAAGGSSLRDYVHADGSLGYFQHSFSVYDREGEPCPRLTCSGTIERVVQSGRSSFHCPVCQK